MSHYYRFVLFVLLTCLSLGELKAQNEDCVTARIISDNGPLSLASSGIGQVNDFANPANQVGCITSGERFSIWLRIFIVSGTQLCFTINPGNNNDIDFAVYGPAPPATCSALGAPVRCNFSGVTGPTGLESGGGAAFSPCLDVQAGQSYYIWITNYSGQNFSAASSMAWGGDVVLAPLVPGFDFTIICNRVAFRNTSAGPAGMTYSWDFDDNGATSTDVNPTYTYTTSRPRNVRLTATLPGIPPVSITREVPMTFTLPQTPVIQDVFNICERATSAVLQATTSPDAVIYWYDNPTATGTALQSGPQLVQTPPRNAVYYLVAENGSGCRSPIKEVRTNVISVQAPVIQDVYNFCDRDQTGTLQATAAVGTTILWYDNPGLTGTPIQTGPQLVQTPPRNAVYYLVAENSLNCRSTVKEVRVNVLTVQAPVVQAIYNFCASDQTGTLQATSETGTTIFWYDNPALTGTPIQTGNQLVQTPPRNAVYYLVAENSLGCRSVSREVRANIISVQTPVIQDVYNFCDRDQTGILQATTSSGATIYWFDNPGLTGAPVQTGNRLEQTPPRNAVYYLIAEDGSGCRSNVKEVRTNVLSVPPVPDITSPLFPTAGPQERFQFCYREPIPALRSNSAGTRWYRDAAMTQLIQVSDTFPVNNLRSDTVYVNAATGPLCQSPVRRIIISIENIDNQPFLSTDLRGVCAGGSATLTLRETYDSYTWQQSTDSTNWQNMSVSGTTIRVTPDRKMYYRALLRRGRCVGFAKAISVDYYTIPTVQVADRVLFSFQGASVQLSASSDRSTVRYEWTPAAGLDNPFSATPRAAPQIDTRYTVRVTDVTGCFAQDEVEVKVVAVRELFTPNGDGINDFFTIYNIDLLPNLEVLIFDRWGRQVYQAVGYRNDWDGGNLMNGTYMYIITSPKLEKPLLGSVTIMR